MSTSLDVAPEENERRAASILHQVQESLGATVFFEKPLTASDASGSGRVVIPKVRCAFFCDVLLCIEGHSTARSPGFS
jgi:hypothetical protein